ncbi:MAG: tetratricopeptide repeat protein [Alcanivorax sp.]
MSDLFTEVDEAMKQERIEQLWQKYGGFLIGLIAVLILGTAANEGYKGWKTNQNTAQTNMYLDAAQSKQDAAQNIVETAPELNTKLRGFALLNAAGMALNDGDTEFALSTYKQIAADESLDPLSVFMARHMIASIDTAMSTEQKINEYAALSTADNNPWKYHAHLELALLKADKNQDFASARDHLSQIIAVESVAESLKKKAQSLDILYAAQGSTSAEFQQN